MSSTRLPPDPYKILGVDSTAELPQIRSAHRKLVLQCHPDKVQDPLLKAQKVDEFQKVQQAYEILSDEKRRTEYDNTVRLHKLREEVSRAREVSREDHDFDVKHAEPKMSSSYPKTSKPPRETPVYSKPPPRSYEDLYEEPQRPGPRRTRTTARDSDRDERDRRRQQAEDEEKERLRQKMEKEAKRSSHDRRDRRRDEKPHPRTGPAYVEEESEEEEYRRMRADKKASSRKAEEAARAEATRATAAALEAAAAREREREQREREQREREQRERERERAAIPKLPPTMNDKWTDKFDNAARYVQASKRQGEPKPDLPFAPVPPMQRAATFAAPPTTPYGLRYETVRATPVYAAESDDETPRRSSAPRPSRRPTTETPTRSKESKSSRRPGREPHIVEPPSPPPVKPSLQKQYSEPPFIGPSRREPSRSKTEYTREKPIPIPKLDRAQTFTHGYANGRERSRTYTKSGSESESESDSESPSPTFAQPGRSTHYVVNGGKTELKGSTYRAEPRSEPRDDIYGKRNRSPSPSRRSRPPLARSGGSSQRQARSQSRGFYPTSAPEAPEPIVLTAQPKPSREAPRNASRGVPYHVTYANPITPEKVVYSSGTQYSTERRAPEPGNRDYSNYTPHRSRPEVYA
ncbi:hypothetical protein ACMFMF_008060 [Clarireedia jacksonii]